MDAEKTQTERNRIYYTGDMANQPGWFFALPLTTESMKLTEDDGEREFVISARQIGDVYHGHCNPRFVTESAYRAFYAPRVVETELA